MLAVLLGLQSRLSATAPREGIACSRCGTSWPGSPQRLGSGWWGTLPGVIGDLPGLGGMTTRCRGSCSRPVSSPLWVVGIGIGTTYYVLPQETGNPLFSRGLAAAGFWSVVGGLFGPSTADPYPGAGLGADSGGGMALGLVIRHWPWPPTCRDPEVVGHPHQLLAFRFAYGHYLLPRAGIAAGTGGVGDSPRYRSVSASPPPLTLSSWSPSSEWPGVLRRLYLSRHPPHRRAAGVQRLLRATPPQDGGGGERGTRVPVVGDWNGDWVHLGGVPPEPVRS